jgi:hypothetical protein
MLRNFADDLNLKSAATSPSQRPGNNVGGREEHPHPTAESVFVT